jgi:asparagine synthase (glutamine-hydrolysing)
MTGYVGGRRTGQPLAAMAAELWTEDWYERERFEAGEYGLIVHHHGDRDPNGVTTWADGDRFGVVDGVVTDGPPTRPGDALFERLLAAPADVLPHLDGPFALAVVDAAADRIVLAADKLGSHPSFYTPDSPVFGTNVGPLVDSDANLTLDTQSVSDLLLLKQVWGERTLVEEASRVPVGSVAVYEDGEWSTTRYWTFDTTPADTRGYGAALATRYQKAVHRTEATVSEDIGVWLSGGLDSRALATTLADRRPSVGTFTYDDSSRGRTTALAAETADHLNLAHAEVDLFGPDQFVDLLQDGVAVTDGLVPVSTLRGVANVFNVDSPPSVLVEGCGQGVLVGSGIWQTDIQRNETGAGILHSAESNLDVPTVQSTLTDEVDPLATYREAVTQSHHDSAGPAAVEALFRNYFTAGDFTTNKLARTQVGTRTPYVDTALIEHACRVPPALRERAVPFTGGVVPYACAPLKLDLVRRLNTGIETIPYERTSLAPTRPLWQHAVGFFSRVASDRLRRRPTYGTTSLSGRWYRTHDGLKNRIDSILDDAVERAPFDESGIRALQREHEQGAADRAHPLFAVATVELWARQYVD